MEYEWEHTYIRRKNSKILLQGKSKATWRSLTYWKSRLQYTTCRQLNGLKGVIYLKPIVWTSSWHLVLLPGCSTVLCFLLFFLIITFIESLCISHPALRFCLSPWSRCIHLCACNLPLHQTKLTRTTKKTMLHKNKGIASLRLFGWYVCLLSLLWAELLLGSSAVLECLFSLFNLYVLEEGKT